MALFICGRFSGESKPCRQKPCWQIYAHRLRGYVAARARVAPLRKCHQENSCTFLVVQPVHFYPHSRAARARQSANMVFANMVSVPPIVFKQARIGQGANAHLENSICKRHQSTFNSDFSILSHPTAETCCFWMDKRTQTKRQGGTLLKAAFLGVLVLCFVF